MDNRNNELRLIISKLKFTRDLSNEITRLTVISLEGAKELVLCLVNDKENFTRLFNNTSNVSNILPQIKNDIIRDIIFTTVLSNEHFSRILKNAQDIFNLAHSLKIMKGPNAHFPLDALIVDRYLKQLKERICEPQEWKRLAVDNRSTEYLYRSFPELSEVRKNSRSLAQGKRDATNPLSLFPKDLLIKIAGETRTTDTSEKAAKTIAHENFNKPKTK